jgi:hypothetical protein
MANTKISQLPSYTGTSSDLRWFVMNNSGETTTYKYSGYSSQVIPGTGVYSLKSIYVTGDTSNPYDMLLGGSANTITNTTKFNTIIGGELNRITANRTDGLSTIFGSYNCLIGPNFCGLGSSIVGSYNSTLNHGGYGSGIFGGYQNSLSDNNAWASVIVGGESNTKSSGRAGFMGGGRSNSCGGGQSVVIGGVSNSISSGNINNSIMGGNNNTISSNAALSSIFGGESNTITLTANRSSILASANSTITGSSDRSSIISSSASTVSGRTQAVMIGCSGRTALYDNTIHVESSYNFKTESFAVINAGSVGGSINVDCSLGTLFYFTITADTTPNFINWNEGQRIQFWVDNSGTFTVPTATISGGGSVYAKAGSINPTNNEITSYYGTIVNGNMFLDEHLNFQPV